MRIACVTTCRGRLNHLRSTLPQNIKDAGKQAFFVVLDYNDQEGLSEYIEQNHRDDIEAGRLIYFQNRDAPRFHMAHAKNQAHRCAMLEGADILITVDADNYNGAGFISFVADVFKRNPGLSYMCPDFHSLPPPGQQHDTSNPFNLRRGYYGRMAIRAQDFLKVGGYNEVFDTWRGEDVDILARLKRLGLKRGAIHPIFLNSIPHSSAVRFREYPDAKRFENNSIFDETEKAHDTVSNYGNIGCGRVYRNFDSRPINLDALPTRIFGLGFQRTGTSSLHAAFERLGFDSGHWRSADWARQIWWDMNKWGRSYTLERDYALSDNPIPMLYEKLDKAYPGSKFILTVRDEDEWIRSAEKFWTYEGNSNRWTWDVDCFSHKMHGIVYGTSEFDEQIFRERYRRHNAEVMQYFRRRSDFLRLDIKPGMSMAPLSRFLDLPEISEPFPHQNKGQEQAAC